jgi:hypothetical protein
MTSHRICDRRNFSCTCRANRSPVVALCLIGLRRPPHPIKKVTARGCLYHNNCDNHDKNPRSLVYENHEIRVQYRSRTLKSIQNAQVCFHQLITNRDRDSIDSRAPVWTAVLKSQSVDLHRLSYTQDELKFHYDWPKQELIQICPW